MRKKVSNHYSIRELKDKFNLEHSDFVFGLEYQIPQQCPRINQFIDDLNILEKHLDKLADFIDNNENGINNKYIQRELNVIKTYQNGISEQFEELRTACDSLRTRGANWKDLALKLFEKLENNRPFIEEKYR